MVVGREAVTSWMSVEAFRSARSPKELHWIDGAGHVDLYDKEPYVGPAVEKLTCFFRSGLSADA
ncbi:alpha/beta hydrolase [Streptomyces sp. NPDC049954]|uniref:alpha/beta hydrolase n=1 Tax=Streptomyces sp. NPDC049954 TaxID=3155779 RepID=UPI00343FC82F